MNDILIMDNLSLMATVRRSKIILTTRCWDGVRLLMERYLVEIYFVKNDFIYVKKIR